MGSNPPSIRIYLPHTPPESGFEFEETIRFAEPGELKLIGQRCGNHWRKIFNISAKIAFHFYSSGQKDWQEYRDTHLCQQGCPISLVFSAQELLTDKTIHIISGHQYCQELCPDDVFETIDTSFRINRSLRVIDSPYFDYRQLNNEKLTRLYSLIESLRIPPKLRLKFRWFSLASFTQHPSLPNLHPSLPTLHASLPRRR